MFVYGKAGNTHAQIQAIFNYILVVNERAKQCPFIQMFAFIVLKQMKRNDDYDIYSESSSTVSQRKGGREIYLASKQKFHDMTCFFSKSKWHELY